MLYFYACSKFSFSLSGVRILNLKSENENVARTFCNLLIYGVVAVAFAVGVGVGVGVPKVVVFTNKNPNHNFLPYA